MERRSGAPTTRDVSTGKIIDGGVDAQTEFRGKLRREPWKARHFIAIDPRNKPGDTVRVSM